MHSWNYRIVCRCSVFFLFRQRYGRYTKTSILQCKCDAVSMHKKRQTEQTSRAPGSLKWYRGSFSRNVKCPKVTDKLGMAGSSDADTWVQNTTLGTNHVAASLWPALCQSENYEEPSRPEFNPSCYSRPNPERKTCGLLSKRTRSDFQLEKKKRGRVWRKIKCRSS